MGIDLDEFDLDPYDVYMDGLTNTQRNKHIGEPPEVKKVRKRPLRWPLWFLLFPYYQTWWIVREVIRQIKKHRV